MKIKVGGNRNLTERLLYINLGQKIRKTVQSQKTSSLNQINVNFSNIYPFLNDNGQTINKIHTEYQKDREERRGRRQEMKSYYKTPLYENKERVKENSYKIFI